MSENPQAGRAPSPADPGLDEAGYATRIEDAFIAERGTPFLVSAKDWSLIRGWREAGVPADTVVRAVREAFERRRARGQAGKISSLAYCADAVAERWEMERRGLVGKEDAPPAAAADAAAIGEELAALAAALRAGDEDRRFASKGADERAHGVAKRRESICGSLRRALDACRGEDRGDPARSSLRRNRAQALLHRGIPRAGGSESNEFLFSCFRRRTRRLRRLGDVSGLAPHVVERMRKALTRREVRALAGFPPLTLLHG